MKLFLKEKLEAKLLLLPAELTNPVTLYKSVNILRGGKYSIKKIVIDQMLPDSAAVRCLLLNFDRDVTI